MGFSAESARSITPEHLHTIGKFLSNTVTIDGKQHEKRKLTQEQKIIAFKDGSNHNPPDLLFKTLAEGYIDFLKAFIAAGGDVNKREDHCEQRTALMWASGFGQLNIVQELLNAQSIEINAVNIHNNTALMYAVSFGSLDVVKKLLNAPGINVNIKGKFLGYSEKFSAIELATYFLHYISATSYQDIVNELSKVKGIEDKISQDLILAWATKHDRLSNKTTEASGRQIPAPNQKISIKYKDEPHSYLRVDGNCGMTALMIVLEEESPGSENKIQQVRAAMKRLKNAYQTIETEKSGENSEAINPKLLQGAFQVIFGNNLDLFKFVIRNFIEDGARSRRNALDLRNTLYYKIILILKKEHDFPTAGEATKLLRDLQHSVNTREYQELLDKGCDEKALLSGDNTIWEHFLSEAVSLLDNVVSRTEREQGEATALESASLSAIDKLNEFADLDTLDENIWRRILRADIGIIADHMSPNISLDNTWAELDDMKAYMLTKGFVLIGVDPEEKSQTVHIFKHFHSEKICYLANNAEPKFLVDGVYVGQGSHRGTHWKGVSLL
ncbi:MAG: ankyrin repeat domain-containing protein [Bdellovibrionota bacterium]